MSDKKVVVTEQELEELEKRVVKKLLATTYDDWAIIYEDCLESETINVQLFLDRDLKCVDVRGEKINDLRVYEHMLDVYTVRKTNQSNTNRKLVFQGILKG